MKTIRLNSTLVIPSLITLIVFTACQKQGQLEKHANDILWYDHPAEIWEEALPLGNGRLGVMVFGKTTDELIQLNDDSMWPGDLGWDEPEGDTNDLKEIRSLLFQGRNPDFMERNKISPTYCGFLENL